MWNAWDELVRECVKDRPAEVHRSGGCVHITREGGGPMLQEPKEKIRARSFHWVFTKAQREAILSEWVWDPRPSTAVDPPL